MNYKRYQYYKEYNNKSDIELFEILLIGRKRENKDKFDVAYKIFVERGYPKSIDSIYESGLSQYYDRALFKIIETKNIYDLKVIEIAKSILINRGFIIDEDTSKMNEKYEKIECIYNKGKELKRTFYTLDDVKIYKDVNLKVNYKTIEKGKLVSYHREVIRNNKNLIQIIENKKKYYLLKDHKIGLCDISVADDNITYMILMKHDDFDKYRLTNVTKNLLPKMRGIKIINKVYNNSEKTIVKFMNSVKKDKKKYIETYEIEFKDNLTDKIKIVRLSSKSFFYSIGLFENCKASKIITCDGREAVILNNIDSYKKILFGLKALMYRITLLIFWIILLIMISLIFIKTRWFVFLGLLFVPVAMFFAKFITEPVYFLINNIVKRL